MFTFRRAKARHEHHPPDPLLPRRTRRWIRALVVAQTLSTLILIGAVYLLIVQRDERRALLQIQLEQIRQAQQADRNYADQQTQALACFIVKPYPNSVNPRVKEFRDQFHCPPYVPPSAKPHPTASVSASVSPHGVTSVPSASPAPVQASAPAGTRTAVSAAPRAASPAASLARSASPTRQAPSPSLSRPSIGVPSLPRVCLTVSKTVVVC